VLVFYEQLSSYSKVLCTAFLFLQLGLVYFGRKENGKGAVSQNVGEIDYRLHSNTSSKPSDPNPNISGFFKEYI